MILKIDSAKHGLIKVLYDEIDHELIKSHRWAVTKIGYNLYALTSVKAGDLWTKEYLHRMIMKPRKGQFVDHISRDTLDNRRMNLRAASPSINALNNDKVGKSGFQNVNKVNNRYRAMIHFEGKHLHGGYFDTPEEAHKKAMEMKDEIFRQHA
jgi:hypothetical protein